MAKNKFWGFVVIEVLKSVLAFMATYCVNNKRIS